MKRLFYRVLEAAADLAALIAMKLYGVVERLYYESSTLVQVRGLHVVMRTTTYCLSGLWLVPNK